MAASGSRIEESGASLESSSIFRLLNAAPRLRELTGAIDLLNIYGLKDHYEMYCRKDLPPSIAESHYLCNVVGDVEIRKGECMELGQLLQEPDSQAPHVYIKPFDFDVLQQAFTLRKSGPMLLPEAEQGVPTISCKVKEKKHKKHKRHKEHKDRHKDKDKHKDRDKIKGKEKERDKDHSKKPENGDDHSRKHHKKKRKHDVEDEAADAHKHKKKKHKHSSKTEKQEIPKSGK